jgi:PAS domain S-box-containing protein
MEMCVECDVFERSQDPTSIKELLTLMNGQFAQYRKKVEAQDAELKQTSMEMAIGLSEVLKALKEIAAGNPDVRISEASHLELMSKLKHMVNLTAENIAEIVDLSHEFAIDLAEHFDVLHRVSKGDLGARVSGTSKVELLESLKNVTNQMIESVAREIAERQRAEEELRSSEAELRESEEKYRSLFSSGPDPLFVLDRETLRILDVNPSGEETYGYSKEELKGKRFTDLGSFQFEADGFKPVGNHGLQNSCLVSSKVQHHKKGGKPFHVNIHACAARYKDRDAMIVAVTDVTDMLEKDAQLIQASKMASLGEMSAGIAHELNQPLNAIKMGTEYLKMMVQEKKPINQEDLLGVVTDASEQVDRAAEIINRLRHFGRKADLVTEKVKISRTVRDLIAGVGHQLKLHNIEVELDLDDSLPPIMAHRNRLEQVLFNLLINARDAINQKVKFGSKDDPKVITICSFQKEGGLVVTVSDTGIGIPTELQQRIFEPFFTTKEVGSGMGLGLSIIYGIVRDYGGEIQVKSEEHVGTTFTITFPVQSL